MSNNKFTILTYNLLNGLSVYDPVVHGDKGKGQVAINSVTSWITDDLEVFCSRADIYVSELQRPAVGKRPYLILKKKS